MERKNQSFIKGAVILSLMVIITKVIGLLFKVPLTNIIGGGGMAYIGKTYAVFTPLFAIAVSGITSCVAKTTAHNYALKRYKNLKKVKKVCGIFFNSCALLITIAMMLTSKYFAKNLMGSEQACWCLVAVAPSILFASALSVERGYYEGLGDMLPTAISETVEAIVKLLLGLGLALGVREYFIYRFEKFGEIFNIVCETKQQAIEISMPFVAAASILGVSLSTGFADIYIIIRSKLKPIKFEYIAFDEYEQSCGEIISESLSFALPVAAASLITAFSSVIDMVTANRLLPHIIEKYPDVAKGIDLDAFGSADFIYGSYTGITLTLAGLIPSLTAMFGKSAFPLIAGGWACSDMKLVRKGLSNVLLANNLICFPASLSLIVLSRPVLNLLYSSRPLEIQFAYLPLICSCAFMIFTTVSVSCFAVAQAVGRPDLQFKIMPIGLLVKLVLNIVLMQIPSLTICSQAISTGISNAVLALISYICVMRITQSKPQILKRVLKPLYCGFMCCGSAGASYIKLYNYTQNLKLSLALSVVFGILVFCICVYLSGIFSVVGFKFNKKVNE